MFARVASLQVKPNASSDFARVFEKKIVPALRQQRGFAGQLLFVSSNAWDVAGAKAFGYQVAWCNRTGAPAEELGVLPDLVIARLDELPS